MTVNDDALRINNPYYASGEGLRAKHQLDRTGSGRSFPQWALDLVPIMPTSRILDAGAGWGRFTWTLVDAYGVDPQNIVCLDHSVGMLHTASQEAAKRDKLLNMAAGEIEALPLGSAAFDGVLANHVLYHLRDIPAGARELARMLRSNGWLLATTNSERIRVLLIDLHYQALEQLGVPFKPEAPSPFSMENGAAYLRAVFRQVETFYFEDEVTYTDAADFVKVYATTGRYRNVLESPDIAEVTRRDLLPTFEQLVIDIIHQEGILRIPILTGTFVCSK